MKYLSLFSGVGGFELGIERAIPDAECIGFSEIDKYATKVYQHHFPNHKTYGDITKIDELQLPDFDLLVGVFPCQSFSIAGKRAGFADTRGTLFFDIARIVREKQPRLLLLENVKGLLSHDKGRTFLTIITTLDELGYDLQWQVLNAKNFGVPQNRERVFIVGHLRGTPRPEVFPFGESGAVSTREDAQRDGNSVAYCLQAGNDKHRGTYINQLNNPIHSNDRVYGTDGVSPTLNTMQGGRRQPFVRVAEATKKGYAEAGEGDSINLSVPNSKTRRGRVGKGVAQTIDTGMQQHTLQHGSIRRLTPLECERLMSFPGGHTEFGRNTEQLVSYKKHGNIEVCNKTKIKKIKNNDVQFKIVSEQKEPTSVTALCTTSGGKGMEILTKELEQINTKTSVTIAIEKSVESGVWKCVTNITKCIGSMEMLYTLKKNVPLQIEMDTYEKQMESMSIDELWKDISEEHYDTMKLSIILTAINSITNCLISTFAQGENMQVSMQLSEVSSKGVLKWEVLSLRTENIEKMSDSTRYKQCGNGVVSNVVEAVVSKMV